MKNIEDLYPLSPLQKSLLVHVLAMPGSRAGFEQKHTTLQGALDVAAFERTWQRVVDRHPILRTGFLVDGMDEPLQAVWKQVKLHFEQSDWRSLSRDEQKRQLAELLAADEQRGFPLQRPPLMRILLIRLADDLYELVWSYHHLLLDAWCRSIVLREVFALYDAFRQGRDLTLPPCRPYRDYIAWLRRQDQAVAQSFWQRMLDGAEASPLRIGRPAGWDGGQEGQRNQTIALPPSADAGLAAFTRRHRLTLGTLIQAVWALLLSRYTGRLDVLFGITVAGRPAELPDVESIMGMFINNLPVRVSVPPDQSVVPWLAGLQQQAVELRQYEHCSPAQIQEWCGFGAGQRLFDTLVLHQNFPTVDIVEGVGAQGLEIRSAGYRLETNYPLTLMSTAGHPATLSLYYDTARFDDAAVSRMLGHLVTLLQGILEQPEAPLAALPLLSEAERHQLLIEWSAGQPVDGLVLLDAQGQPVPIGVLGEVCRAGADQRTGDLARFRPDGRIEWLGCAGTGEERIAREIEAALRNHPGVARAAAEVRGPAGGAAAPAVFVEAAAEHRLEEAEIRRFLRRWLPDLGLPLAVTVLERLPLLPDGSVDRAALPASGDGRSAPGELQRPERTPVEEVLVQVWADLLGVHDISVREDLFELGVHSLLAIRFVSRVRSTFAVDLPLRVLFEEPTIAGLAARIERALKGETAEAPPIERAPDDAEKPLSFAQERLWFMHKLEPATAAYNVPRAIRLSGPLDGGALERALTEIARRHETLRCGLPEVEGRAALVVAPPSPVPLPWIDLSGLPAERLGAEVERLAREEAGRPFDLARGPLLRVRLIHEAPEEHVALFTTHHIVSDAWSMGILVREMALLYGALLADRPSPLPELPIQYSDYARWQRQWLQGEVLESQLAYWRQQLAAMPEDLEMPTDRPRPLQRTFAGAFLPFSLSPEVSAKLLALGRREGATLFMTLLAAFKILLHRQTGQTDIVVGTDVANRNRLEVEELIGFFINNLVLRTDLSGNPTFRDLLRRVRNMTLGAFAHQELPFDELARELQPRRRPGRLPFFEVLFVLQNTPAAPLQLSGLSLRPQIFDFGTSKFDLALFLWETPQGLQGAWNYRTHLFEAATVARFGRCYAALLASAAENPDARLSQLEMLDREERERRDIERQERQQTRIGRLGARKATALSLSADNDSAAQLQAEEGC